MHGWRLFERCGRGTKKRTRCAPVRLGIGSAAVQRLAMYIVISNPKRRSVKVGVVHCIVDLLVGWVGMKRVC